MTPELIELSKQAAEVTNIINIADDDQTEQ